MTFVLSFILDECWTKTYESIDSLYLTRCIQLTKLYRSSILSKNFSKN